MSSFKRRLDFGANMAALFSDVSWDIMGGRFKIVITSEPSGQ